MAIMFFLFEYTKLGNTAKQSVKMKPPLKFVGVPVSRMKIVAFAISGLWRV